MVTNFLLSPTKWYPLLCKNKMHGIIIVLDKSMYGNTNVYPFKKNSDVYQTIEN